MSAEALISLQNLIIKQDVYTFDETSRQSLQRHVQKLANATQMFFAKSALQQDQIRFLTTINNEAIIRRSTKSMVLGKVFVFILEFLNSVASSDTLSCAVNHRYLCKAPLCRVALSDKVSIGRTVSLLLQQKDLGVQYTRPCFPCLLGPQSSTSTLMVIGSIARVGH